MCGLGRLTIQACESSIGRLATHPLKIMRLRISTMIQYRNSLGVFLEGPSPIQLKEAFTEGRAWRLTSD